MQLPREVKLLIRPDGVVEVETFGFSGTSCAELSAYLEKVLTGVVDDPEFVERHLKPEYFVTDEAASVDVEDRDRG